MEETDGAQIATKLQLYLFISPSSQLDQEGDPVGQDASVYDVWSDSVVPPGYGEHALDPLYSDAGVQFALNTAPNREGSPAQPLPTSSQPQPGSRTPSPPNRSERIIANPDGTLGLERVPTYRTAMRTQPCFRNRYGGNSLPEYSEVDSVNRTTSRTSSDGGSEAQSDREGR